MPLARLDLTEEPIAEATRSSRPAHAASSCIPARRPSTSTTRGSPRSSRWRPSAASRCSSTAVGATTDRRGPGGVVARLPGPHLILAHAASSTRRARGPPLRAARASSSTRPVEPARPHRPLRRFIVRSRPSSPPIPVRPPPGSLLLALRCAQISGCSDAVRSAGVLGGSARRGSSAVEAAAGPLGSPRAGLRRFRAAADLPTVRGLPLDVHPAALAAARGTHRRAGAGAWTPATTLEQAGVSAEQLRELIIAARPVRSLYSDVDGTTVLAPGARPSGCSISPTSSRFFPMPDPRVNGTTTRSSTRRTLAGGRPPRRPRPHGHEGRLRRGALRRLHSPAGRCAGAVLHHARAHGRRPRGDDDRRPARGIPSSPRSSAPTRSSAGSARPARSSRPPRSSRRMPTRRTEEIRPAGSPATSAAAAPIRASRRRSPAGAADQVREGGRGPLRGGLDARRRGRARPVAGRPGDVVGRDAPRLDGFEKARGEARYTADVQLPGMLHTALLHSPHARSRVRRIDLAPAEAAPGVLAAIGPGEVDGVGEEADFEGYVVAAVAAETLEQAEAAVRLDRDRLGGARAAARPQGWRSSAGLLVSESRRYQRGDYERGLAEADAVVESDYVTQTLNHNSMETHQCVCHWRGGRGRRLPLDASHLDGPQRARGRAGAARGQGAGDLRVHGRGLRLPRPGSTAHCCSPPSSLAARDGPCTAP